MLFTTRNKLKEKKENEELDMLSEVLTFLTAASITKAALEDLENHPECLENMVKKAEAEEFSNFQSKRRSHWALFMAINMRLWI